MLPTATVNFLKAFSIRPARKYRMCSLHLQKCIVTGTIQTTFAKESYQFCGEKTECKNRRMLTDRLRALKIHKSAKIRSFNNKKN